MTKTGDFLTYPIADGVKLHVYPAPRFKTVGIHVYAQQPLGPETTANALLPNVLRRGCRRTPTQRAIVTFLEGLYGAALSADVLKLGERHCLTFRVDVVHDRFAPGRTRLVRAALEFLHRLLTAPVLADGIFPSHTVAQEKVNHRNWIEGLINDRMAYATERCIEAMCPEEEYRRYVYGRTDDLDAITPRSLRERHRRLLREAPIDIVVTGPVRGPEIASAVARAFRFRGRTPSPLPPTTIRAAPPTPRVVGETRAVEQGKLVIGVRTGITLADDGVYALATVNGILGAFPHSKLFRNVREREGLAYDARSYVDRTKGILFMQAGIDPARYETARDVILDQMEAVRRGDITEEEWDSTRKCLRDRLRSLEDSPSRMAASLLEGLVNGRVRAIEDARAALDRVTREDAMRAASALKVDTIYFLRSS